MPPESTYQNPRLEIWLKWSGLFATVFSFSIALFSFLDLYFEWGLMMRLAPKSPEMQPITSIAFMISAAAIVKFHPRTMRLLGSVVFIIAGVVLAEYLTRENVQLNFSFLVHESAQKHLPAPETAISFLFSSLAIILKSTNKKNINVLGELFAFISIAIALLALSGFFVEVNTKTSIFYPSLRAIGMALNTALAFILLNIGIINLKLENEHSLFASTTLGGVVARRLITVLTISPIIIQISINLLVDLKIFEEPFRLPLALILTYVIFMTFTWTVAKATESIDIENRILGSKLKLSDDNYRTFINTASDGIFIADLSGKYTYVNESGAEILGYKPDEILGKTIIDLIPNEDIPKLEESKNKMLQSGVIHIAEWRLRKKDGTYVPVEVSAKILKDGRWQGFVRDISDRKEQEQKEKFQLELNKKLSETMMAKERLDFAAKLLIRDYADCCYISVTKEVKNIDYEISLCKEDIRFDFQIINTIAKNSLFLKTIQRKKQILVSKENSSSFYDAYLNKNISLPYSILVLPLVARERILGIIFLLKYDTFFLNKDIDFIKGVVNIMSILTDNALLYEE